MLAAVALSLVACGLVSPSPSAPTETAAPAMVRAFTDGDGRAWHLLVYDPAGLLIDVRQQPHGTSGATDIRWEPIVGSPDSLILEWLGGVCATDRTLTIGKQGSKATLAVFEGHNRQLASREACPAVGVFYWLKLTFRQPIADFDFSLSFTELPQ
jgi:hypothetical protein